MLLVYLRLQGVQVRVAHELELLAIVLSRRVYLHGQHFTVHTDHYPLRYLETQGQLSSRQVRWKNDIQYKNLALKKVIERTTSLSSISYVQPGEESISQLNQDCTEDPEFESIYRNPKKPFEKINGLLYLKQKLCLPKGLYRSKLLHD